MLKQPVHIVTGRRTSVDLALKARSTGQDDALSGKRGSPAVWPGGLNPMCETTLTHVRIAADTQDTRPARRWRPFLKMPHHRVLKARCGVADHVSEPQPSRRQVLCGRRRSGWRCRRLLEHPAALRQGQESKLFEGGDRQVSLLL